MELHDETFASEPIIVLPETDWGNIEYKRRLIGLSKFRKEQLITQMRWRLSEGKGIAEYYVGVDDDGSPYPLTEKEYTESIETILSMTVEAGASAKRLHVKRYPTGIIFTLMIQIRNSSLDEYRWIVIGPSKVGKTTLISCLIDGLVDDGNGSLRNRKLKHLHELDSGCTTQPVFSYKEQEDSMMLVFIDLPGGKKYLDDTIIRSLAYRPTGVLYVEREDTLSNNPFSNLAKELSNSGVPVLRVMIGGGKSSSSNASHFECYPCISGGCNNLMKRVLYISQHAREPVWRIDDNKNTRIIICEIMDSLDLGLVIHGIVISGTVKIGDRLELIGHNKILIIDSLHRYKKPVTCVDEDTSTSFTIQCDDIQSIRKHLQYGLLATPGASVKQHVSINPVYSANGYGNKYLITPIIETTKRALVPTSPLLK
jgi:GTPase